MNIEIKPSPQKKTEIKYPCIMESIDDDTIVLFTAPTSGVALRYLSGVSHYSTSWVEADAHLWKPFLGTITISN